MLLLPSPLVAKKKKCRLRQPCQHLLQLLKLSRTRHPLLPLPSPTLLPPLLGLLLVPWLTQPLALQLLSLTQSRSPERALLRAAPIKNGRCFVQLRVEPPAGGFLLG